MRKSLRHVGLTHVSMLFIVHLAQQFDVNLSYIQLM